jgi:hypothetical protein
MKFATTVMKMVALFVGLTLVGIFAGCNNNPAPVVSSERIPPVSEVNPTDAQRLSNGASKLITAMKKPGTSFHFSYQAQENLTDDKSQPPRVGPITLQADFSPEKINLLERRGSTTKTVKAQYGEEVKWGMANLTTLRVMTSPTLVVAVGAGVTSPPTTDLVGMIAADKFTFDTAAASTPYQKTGVERARIVVRTIRGCKGTAWIAEDSGQLIKFNIDADYLDKNNQAWKEHYEGLVTPK